MNDPVRQSTLKVLQHFAKPNTQQPHHHDKLVHVVAQYTPPEYAASVYALSNQVLRRWFVLTRLIQDYSHHPLQRLRPTVRALLYLGLYQLLFDQTTPDYAALNSTLELAKQPNKQVKGQTKTVGFLNALFRNVQRAQQTNTLDLARLNEDYGLPEWLKTCWQKQYGTSQTQKMNEARLLSPPLSVRVNTLKATVEAVKACWQEHDIVFKPTSLPDCLIVEDYEHSPETLPGFAQGWLYMQDLSSAEVAHWVDPQPDEMILDLCAAPGSKTTHMAALSHNRARLFAYDPSPKRLRRLQDNLARLGVIKAQCETSLEALLITLPPEDRFFDRILVDAPCSGLGTLKRHPEILLQINPIVLEQTYPKKQKTLLMQAAQLLKPGGMLIYSTCSTQACENQDVADDFLQQQPAFKLIKSQQRPITPEADGFFIAHLQKTC